MVAFFVILHIIMKPCKTSKCLTLIETKLLCNSEAVGHAYLFHKR